MFKKMKYLFCILLPGICLTLLAEPVLGFTYETNSDRERANGFHLTSLEMILIGLGVIILAIIIYRAIKRRSH
jgi:hypothetical protein